MSDNVNLLNQYELVSRVDRHKGQHGGVAVLCKTSSDLVTRQINFLKNDFGTAFAVDISSEALFLCAYTYHRSQANTEYRLSNLNYLLIAASKT